MALAIGLLSLGPWSGQVGAVGQSIPDCPGNLGTQLAVGMQAFVTPDPPLSNIVRDQPGGREVARIRPGQDFTVIGGPECVNNAYWWLVHRDGLPDGWTMEGDATSYFVLPCSWDVSRQYCHFGVSSQGSPGAKAGDAVFPPVSFIKDGNLWLIQSGALPPQQLTQGGGFLDAVWASAQGPILLTRRSTDAGQTGPLTWVQALDGTAASAFPGNVYQAVAAPDGQHMALLTDQGLQIVAVPLLKVVAELPGGNVQRLFTWSADSQSVFYADPDSLSTFSWSSLTTRVIAKVPSPAESWEEVAYSPATGWIAAWLVSSEALGDIYLISPEGETVSIPNYSGVQAVARPTFAWSADGQLLAFSFGTRAEGPGKLVLLDMTTRAPLAGLGPLPEGLNPTFDPPNVRLIFTSPRGALDEFNFLGGDFSVPLLPDVPDSWLTNINFFGGETHYTVTATNAPLWSPDREWIIQPYATGFYIMNYRDQEQRLWIAGGTRPAWQPIAVAPAVDVAKLVARKNLLIDDLESLSFDFVEIVDFFELPTLRSYNEQEEAQSLADALGTAGSTASADQVTDFQRLTLFEQALDDLFPTFARATHATTRSVTSILILSASMLRMLNQAVTLAGKTPVVGAQMAKLLDATRSNVLDLTNDLMEWIATGIPDATNRERFEVMRTALIKSTGAAVEPGSAIREGILDSIAVVGDEVVLGSYVSSTQTILDQAVEQARDEQVATGTYLEAEKQVNAITSDLVFRGQDYYADYERANDIAKPFEFLSNVLDLTSMATVETGVLPVVMQVVSLFAKGLETGLYGGAIIVNMSVMAEIPDRLDYVRVVAFDPKRPSDPVPSHLNPKGWVRADAAASDYLDQVNTTLEEAVAEFRAASEAVHTVARSGDRVQLQRAVDDYLRSEQDLKAALRVVVAPSLMTAGQGASWRQPVFDGQQVVLQQLMLLDVQMAQTLLANAGSAVGDPLGAQIDAVQHALNQFGEPHAAMDAQLAAQTWDPWVVTTLTAPGQIKPTKDLVIEARLANASPQPARQVRLTVQDLETGNYLSDQSLPDLGSAASATQNITLPGREVGSYQLWVETAVDGRVTSRQMLVVDIVVDAPDLTLGSPAEASGASVPLWVWAIAGLVFVVVGTIVLRRLPRH